MSSPIDQDRVRRQILRRATLYTVGFLGAGLFIALAGAALVAWMLGRVGLPFMRTWLIVTLIVVLPGLIAATWKTLRGK